MNRLKPEHFFEILERYRSGEASQEEVDFLNAYYQSFGLRDDFTTTLSEEKRELFKQDIKLAIDEAVKAGNQKKSRRTGRRIYKWLGPIAALLIVAAGLSLYYFPRNKQAAMIASNELVEDIAPGGNKAILTLANGQKISLTDADNGTLVEQAGVQITKTASGELIYKIIDDSDAGSPAAVSYNTIETPKGGQYQVSLPDGSRVWLNAASKITYPSTFIHQGARRVSLEGEAYFEVAKDKSHPFIVKTQQQEVTVLGTHFNINSYDDEDAVKTTLLEGSVRVVGNSVGEKVLKPGQQSSLGADHLKVEAIDTELAVAWKNSQFVFESDDIRYIMRMISRWYDVDIKYIGEITDEKFGGSVSRFENVSEVLKALESTGKVKFRIQGKQITVMK